MRWEYHSLHMNDESKDKLRGILDSFGENGWELIAISPMGKMFFKRPKNPEDRLKNIVPPKFKIDKLGVFRLFWKSGGFSWASVGSDSSGNLWFAPSNWVTVPSFDWSDVERVEQFVFFGQ